jgi:hypothetical protein
MIAPGGFCGLQTTDPGINCDSGHIEMPKIIVASPCVPGNVLEKL